MSNTSDTSNDINLVEMWLRVDPKRWLAGALGGLTAMAAMLGFAALKTGDLISVLKIPAAICFGNQALAMDSGAGMLIYGVLLYVVLAVVLGTVYAHMTGTNHKGALFGVGITWGIFSWIFLNNLFSKSWRPMFVIDIPGHWALAGWLVFGVCLMSVGFYDSLLKGNKNL